MIESKNAEESQLLRTMLYGEDVGFGGARENPELFKTEEEAREKIKNCYSDPSKISVYEITISFEAK